MKMERLSYRRVDRRTKIQGYKRQANGVLRQEEKRLSDGEINRHRDRQR